MEIPEAIWVEILARLPLRTITRFKCVSKIWKSILESSYLRGRFLSLHKNSHSSWSLIFKTEFRHSSTGEVLGFHGCNTWNVPKSPGSYTIPFQDSCYISSSNGLVWIRVPDHRFFVGNPVLHNWVEVPGGPGSVSGTGSGLCRASGLVTYVEEGVVLSFKIIMSCGISILDGRCWRVNVYSSETGMWSFKRLRCSSFVGYRSLFRPVSIDGSLYLCENEYLVAYDFYGSDNDECRVIPLPCDLNKGALTTSGGDLMYLDVRVGRLKIWKMNNINKSGGDSEEWWKLLWDVKTMPSLDFFPLAMNPFDTHLVYLWSQEEGCLVSGNLRSNEFIVHRESESECCLVNTEKCMEYMKEIIRRGHYGVQTMIVLSQFVLPPWMPSVPLSSNCHHNFLASMWKWKTRER